jgi:hypothetical protein
MAVKLLGLPREEKQRIMESGLTFIEYFKNGFEIKTFADLRKYMLWLMRPSGNGFIYRALNWVAESPVTDEDFFYPSWDRCTTLHSSGRQCLLHKDHTGKCKVMGWLEY